MTNKGITRREAIDNIARLLGIGGIVLGGIGVAQSSKNTISKDFVKKSGDTMTGDLQQTGVGNRFIAKTTTGGFATLNEADGNVYRNIRGRPDVLNEMHTVLSASGNHIEHDFLDAADGVSDWAPNAAGFANSDFFLTVLQHPSNPGALSYDITPSVDQLSYGSSNYLVQIPLLSLLSQLTRKRFGMREVNNTDQMIALPSPTRISEGTGAGFADNIDNISTFTRATSGNAAGNRGGWQSATFNLFRRDHRPSFGILFRAPGPDLNNVRLWIVLTSVNIGASDSPAADLLGIRFSSGVTPAQQLDIVSKDGTTLAVQSTTGAAFISSVLVTVTFFWSDANTIKVGTIIGNPGSQSIETFTVTSNLPRSGINLGFQATVENKTTANKNFNLSHLLFEAT